MRELHELYRLLLDAPPGNLRPRWNGAPTEALLQLAQPPHPGPYAVRPVSDKVNNVRNDGPDLLEQE